MTLGPDKTSAPRFLPLLRAVAEVSLRLEQAIEALEAQPANQTGLLWTFALLVARDPHAGAAGAGRLGELLSAIDHACARSPAIRSLVEELNALLVPRNIELLWRALGGPGCGCQAWVYLLENLWAATDARLRRRRGGYFTPQPIVRFIVHSVDALLRHELNVAGGLACAEASLRIIDPACGSGAFLLGAIECIRTACGGDTDPARWLSMARDILPRRLVGIDVMPACCGAAEILLESQLGARWSAHCGNILDEVEYARHLCGEGVPIILGNPPYANFGRRNRGRWILEQLDDYKTGLGERKHNLDDDFIKFLRWGQYWIDRSDCGILAMVTNNTYLNGLTHRQMRASLARTFDRIYVLDLHGNSKKRERTPAGDADENVFGVQQGVAIGLFVKRRPAGQHADGQIQHADLWGSRSEKLEMLATADLEQLPGQPLQPRAPNHFFVPHRDDEEGTYRQFPRLDQIFQQHVSGVQTKCDALFVGFTREEVELRMRACLADAARGCLAPNLPGWLPPKLRGVSFDATCMRRYMVAPWDMRWIYYEPRLLGRARQRVMRHMDSTNTALVFMRQATTPDAYDHFLATCSLVSDRVFYSAHGAPFVAPLFVTEAGARTTNFSRTFLEELAGRLEARWDDEGTGSARSFGTYDVFHWIYAVVHSLRYRRCYHAVLSIDFPRIPWPRDFDMFCSLAQLGEQLAAVHCGVAAADVQTRAGLPTPPPVAVVEDPRWIPPDTLMLNSALRWPEPIDEAIWRFRIGGYAVLHRWLKQRQQRALTADDQQHLQRMIRAIRATVRQVPEIDRIIQW